MKKKSKRIYILLGILAGVLLIGLSIGGIYTGRTFLVKEFSGELPAIKS